MSFPAELATARPRLFPLLGMPAGATAFNPAVAWRPRSLPDRFRLPFGVTVDRTAVALDLKSAEFGGVGPHGIVVGVAGSGKSELLRTLVLALTATHAPTTAAVVLVDTGSRGTFRGLDSAPHVFGAVDGVAAEPARLDRLHELLAAEMERRMSLLSDNGFHHVAKYTAARAAGADLTPLPLLVIVADDLHKVPDIGAAADEFLKVARVGRSVGMHLLFATQRYVSQQWRGLDSYLGYRVGLRCVTEQDSVDAIGVPAASSLPRKPGVGYFVHCDGGPVPVKIALSGPVPRW